MARVLIVYYSRSGHTEEMARHIADGVRQGGVADVEVRDVERTKVDDLLAPDGIIMGSPTYYGGMASELKRLLDESVSIHGRLDGKVGGAFASAANIGGGNETTILQIVQAFLVHGMVTQGIPKGDHYGPVAINKPDARAIKQCLRLGDTVAKLVMKLHG